MLKDILKLIITGVPHSGTTPLADVFRQSPNLVSGADCGFLLCDHPRDFPETNKKYYEKLQRAWQLSEEDIRYISDSDEWEEVYVKLRERCPQTKNKHVFMFDKTPDYIFELDEILDKAEGIPFVVIFKDPRLLYYSLKRRNVSNRDGILSLFNRPFREKLQKYQEEGRLCLVRYEDMCLKGEETLKKVFEFTGFEFNKAFLNFTSKYQPQYGKGIQSRYVSVYKGELTRAELDSIHEWARDDFFYFHDDADIDSKSETERPSIYNVSWYSKHRMDAYNKLFGRGPEIGAFNNAAIVPEDCNVIYADIFTREEAFKYFPEQKEDVLKRADVIHDMDKEGLAMFRSLQFDFVLLNRVIEHVANPIKSIKEVFRVTRKKGSVIISAFEKDATVLIDFPSTPFSRVLERYRQDVNSVSRDLYVELLRIIDSEVFEKEHKEMEKDLEALINRREHVNRWNSETFKAFLTKSFELLNIRAECIYESTGDENKTEYFSVWEKL